MCDICTAFEKITEILFENRKNMKDNDYIKVMEHLKILFDNKEKAILKVIMREKICPESLVPIQPLPSGSRTFLTAL